MNSLQKIVTILILLGLLAHDADSLMDLEEPEEHVEAKPPAFSLPPLKINVAEGVAVSDMAIAGLGAAVGE